MYRFIFLILCLYSITSYSQTIPAFKSDQDCLKFIQTRIKGMEKFNFVTLFSNIEISKLSPDFKYWQRIDINGDNMPDLPFVGAFKGWKSHSNTAQAYISQGGSYMLFPIVREDGTGERPHVFIQKQNNQNLIVIHPYHFSCFEKDEDLIKKGALHPQYVDGDDTLMYKFNTLIDYVSNLSKIIFDSVKLVEKYGWHCNVDSFIIYKNGSGRYYSGCQDTLHPKPFQETNIRIGYLKELIQTIDLEHCRKERYVNGTDQNGAEFEIYHDGKAEMSQIPPKVGQADLIAYLILNPTHIKTNNTRHYVDGQLLTDVCILAICKYEGGAGFYLFYCDLDWNELTDTYHESIEDAIDQAEYEFANSTKDWIFPE